MGLGVATARAAGTAWAGWGGCLPLARALLWGLFACLSLVGGSVWAADTGVAGPGDAMEQVATVVAVRGEVTASSRAGVIRKLTLKAPLYRQDTITTAGNGRLQIMFRDNTIFSLGRQTVLKLEEYNWNAGQKKGRLQTEVKDGVFRVMGGLITKTTPEEFAVKTASSVIGIRGSMFTGKVAARDVTVMFEGGKGITMRNGGGMVVIDKPGFGSRSESWQSPPAPPSRFSERDAGGLYQGMTVSRGRGGAASRVAGPASRLPAPSFSPRQMLAPPPIGGPGAPPGGGAPQSLATLTATVKAEPEKAVELLRDAVVKDGIPVDKALGAVLGGMASPDRQQFDSVVREAMDHGLTVKEAKAIAEQLKASGGACQ